MAARQEVEVSQAKHVPARATATQPFRGPHLHDDVELAAERLGDVVLVVLVHHELHRQGELLRGRGSGSPSGFGCGLRATFGFGLGLLPGLAAVIFVQIAPGGRRAWDRCVVTRMGTVVRLTYDDGDESHHGQHRKQADAQDYQQASTLPIVAGEAVAPNGIKAGVAAVLVTVEASFRALAAKVAGTAAAHQARCLAALLVAAIVAVGALTPLVNEAAAADDLAHAVVTLQRWERN